MLRTAVILVAMFSAVVGLLGLLSDFPLHFSVAIWSFALLFAVICERWRYTKKAKDRLSTQWKKTEERFVDPESGAMTVVWFNPKTGERRYVPEASGDSPA
jgi:hypothetical protein